MEAAPNDAGPPDGAPTDSAGTATGVLLVNLGTPDAPRAPEVRRYLAEFLSDPYVIDIHPVGRWLLLHLVILPFRPAKSAAAYAKVWTPAGSPLLVFGNALRDALRERLQGVPVELAMRYGRPSIAAGLAALQGRGVRRVVALPLYPQEAASSTTSSAAELEREAARLGLALDVVPPFFDDAGFLTAWEHVGAEALAGFDADHVLFSYHGLPERHMKQGPTGSTCLASEGCCDALTERNARCYRAQCFATTRALAERLGLAPERHSLAFQSRLGRTPWIRPYTDEVVPELARKGVRRLAVFCPAFVADCLETLEEIGMRAAEDFRAAGGEELRLVPSLNAHPAWVAAAEGLVRGRLRPGGGSGAAAEPGAERAAALR